LRKTPEPIGQNARWLCLWKNSTSEFNIDLLKVIGMLIRYLDTRVLTGLHVQLATQTVTVDDQNLDAVSSFVSIGWSEEQLIQAQKDDPDVKFLLDLLETSVNRHQWKDVEFPSLNKYHRAAPKGRRPLLHTETS